MQQSTSIVELRTTFARREEAEACAERLVSLRLAACVQIEGPVRSTYRWQGAVDRADEFRCTCKTTPALADACAAAILQEHPYQTPELLRGVVTATIDYAAWVRASVGED